MSLKFTAVRWYSRRMLHSKLSQMRKIGNIDINANYVTPYICSFILYLH